ncbi:MAG: hypothetical protein H6744_00745 [Deltaproteobacteria bacterium]|nr:hypothetical protein [Deltaproteobacteria bacterium]MCB9785193.1 hypothetical protein [Deltaproteobacteria bacterium]
MARWLAVSLAAAVLCVTGCTRVSGDAERERRIAAEQRAIQEYSEKIPEVDKLQERFLVEWRKANEIRDLKAFKDALEAQVLPALDAYLATLKLLPARTEQLAAIHGVMVTAYTDAVAAFRTFVAGLTNDNVEARYRVLLDTMDAVGAAEQAYREKLETYYADNRVKLVTGTSE